jgi:hypothetical protein
MTQKPLLSILIPTVVGREEQCERLLKKIKGACSWTESKLNDKGCEWHCGYMNNGEVGFIICKDDKNLTIGEKRELLYKEVSNPYSWQIDDDDDVANSAIELILEAIKSNPEVPCITFRERCMMNGVYKSSNHSICYSQWMDNQDGFDYVRSPFYKDVIRTDIAKSVPFEHIRYNEDERWSKALYPLLTSEIHIDEELYYYNYEPKDTHEQRYGIL